MLVLFVFMHSLNVGGVQSLCEIKSVQSHQTHLNWSGIEGDPEQHCLVILYVCFVADISFSVVKRLIMPTTDTIFVR